MAASVAAGRVPRWRPSRTASRTPAPAMMAIRIAARDRPAASASAGLAPAPWGFAIAAAYTVAVAATASEPPTYRAMLEMPEAAPPSAGSTDDVEADEAGPLARPRPTAMITSGA